MQQQLDFDTPAFTRYRSSDPDTSRDAAFSININHLQEIVLKAIRSFGDKGCIFDDIQDMHPNISHSGISTRFSELVRKGLIEDTGIRRVGKHGRKQRVMRAL